MRDYLYKGNPARESMLEMFCGQAIFYYICTAYNEKQMEGKFPNSVAIPPYTMEHRYHTMANMHNKCFTFLSIQL